MDIYADYKYYLSIYNGVIMPEERFELMAREASVFLKYYTNNRIMEPYPEEVKCATCAIAENIYETMLAAKKKNAVAASGIQREDNDGYVVTYFSPAELSNVIVAAKDENKAIARRYLMHTGLLYRGIDHGNQCGYYDL